MKTFTQTMLASLLMLLISSCTKDPLHGSGNIVTETRLLSPFTEVSINGVHEAEIIFSNENKVEINGYEVLAKTLESNINGNRLSLEYPKNTRVQNDNLRFKIYTSNIMLLRQTGNSKIKINQGFNPEFLRVVLIGNSFLEIDENNTNSFRIVASGRSKIIARKLLARNVEVTVSGNSEVELTAINYLNVEASGSTKVWYWGTVTNSDIKTTGLANVSRQ